MRMRTAHNNAIFDLQWTADDRHIVTACGDQSARVWDVERQECLSVFQGHGCSLKSVDSCGMNSNLFVTAGRDGKIMTWDRRCTGIIGEGGERIQRPTTTLRNAHLPSNSKLPKKRRSSTATPSPTQSVASVRFWPQHPNSLISCGAGDGVIKIWDLRGAGRLSAMEVPMPVEKSSGVKGRWGRVHGFSSMCLDKEGQRIWATCTDNSIFEFTPHNLNSPLRTLTSPTFRVNTFYIKCAISRDASCLASGSSDGGIYMWDVRGPSTHSDGVVLRGHYEEVTSVAWGGDGVLGSCADDSIVRVWRVPEEDVEEDVALKGLRGRAEAMERAEMEPGELRGVQRMEEGRASSIVDYFGRRTSSDT